MNRKDTYRQVTLNRLKVVSPESRTRLSQNLREHIELGTLEHFGPVARFLAARRGLKRRTECLAAIKEAMLSHHPYLVVWSLEEASPLVGERVVYNCEVAYNGQPSRMHGHPATVVDNLGPVLIEFDDGERHLVVRSNLDFVATKDLDLEPTQDNPRALPPKTIHDQAASVSTRVDNPEPLIVEIEPSIVEMVVDIGRASWRIAHNLIDLARFAKRIASNVDVDGAVAIMDFAQRVERSCIEHEAKKVETLDKAAEAAGVAMVADDEENRRILDEQIRIQDEEDEAAEVKAEPIPFSDLTATQHTILKVLKDGPAYLELFPDDAIVELLNFGLIRKVVALPSLRDGVAYWSINDVGRNPGYALASSETCAGLIPGPSRTVYFYNLRAGQMERFKRCSKLEAEAVQALKKLTALELEALKHIANTPNMINTSFVSVAARGYLVRGLVDDQWRLTPTGLDLVPFIDQVSEQ